MNFKNIMNSFPVININRIVNQIDKYEIISFDIFDTLIKRDVQTENDIFEITEKLFNQKTDEKIYGYRKIRTIAEEEARSKSALEEITIDRLRESLIGKKIGENITITNEAAELLLDCEREVESHICIRNKILYPIYRYCLNTKKRIILISDMYWEKDFLNEILKNSGIEGYDAIYVSSEYGAQKKTGSLFKVVIKEEKVSAGSILHIGDNKKGDFLSARRAGLRAISIPKLVDNTKYMKQVKSNTLEWTCCERFISNRLLLLGNERIGYEVYGPLLFSFVKWLSERLDSNKTTLFFARDCYVVKSAYELYTGEISEKNVYFLGSRRSLIIPTLRHGADLNRVAILIKSEPKKLTVSGLLRKLGVDASLYLKQLTEFNITENTIIDRDDLGRDEGFVVFYKTIEKKIVMNARKEYENFRSYWDSLNCTHDIQIIDIGWRGTMQHCLEELLGNEYNIKGFYLGIRKDATISNYEDIFLNGKSDFEKECFLAGMTSLIEIFFSAPHGSVGRYLPDGQIEYLPYECEDDEESRLLVERLQQGAKKFVGDYSGSILSKLVPISPSNMFSSLFIMGVEPESEELQSFGRFPFQMGSGVARNIDEKGILTYCCNPKVFFLDFSVSNWKVGFLKKCMKLKMPYYSLFKWIYKHRG